MKTKEVILSVNVPEPGDTLPFIALGTDENWLIYYETNGELMLCSDGVLAGFLGIPMSVNPQQRTVVA